jgi:hypothetical protein
MSAKPQDDEHPLEPQLEDVLDAVRASEGEPKDAAKVERDEPESPASP